MKNFIAILILTSIIMFACSSPPGKPKEENKKEAKAQKKQPDFANAELVNILEAEYITITVNVFEREKKKADILKRETNKAEKIDSLVSNALEENNFRLCKTDNAFLILHHFDDDSPKKDI